MLALHRIFIHRSVKVKQYTFKSVLPLVTVEPFSGLCSSDKFAFYSTVKSDKGYSPKNATTTMISSQAPPLEGGNQAEGKHFNSQQGHRQFYQFEGSVAYDAQGIAKDAHASSAGPTKNTTGSKKRSKSSRFRGSTRELIEMIERNVIGRETAFQGPFGARRCVYMDHTASGQPLRCIEDFLKDHVLPYYGNTHTTTTLTSSQTTMYRHEARDIIRNAVGASEQDAVIFTGTGSTAAIHTITHALAGNYNKPRPIVFVGPYEHHSNILPWRDVGAKLVNIPEDVNGLLDLVYLEEELKNAVAAEGASGRDLIGAFSAASNLTGIPTNDIAVTVLMHKYGGLALWDYSAAAPHVQVVMNPVIFAEKEQGGAAKKDAIYFSGHKFVGGPQTPGVLIAKKSLFENRISSVGGGGTVFFVTSDSHRYLKNVEFREEGGTPGILESIRLGLVFRLQETVGYQNIISREAGYIKKILEDWSKIPEIKILGPTTYPRLPIVSFLIEHSQSGYFLHHNFVAAVLNDLFGIQSRGGCGCAGPYAQTILGIDLDLARSYENLLLEDGRLDRDHLRRLQEGSAYEIFRPGFTRISIPYHASYPEVEYVSEAVQLIATQGWRILPLYTFNPETGEFHHHINYLHQRRLWLSNATFDVDGIRAKERSRYSSEDYPNYKECLEQAKSIFANAHNLCRRRNLPNQSLVFDSSVAHLRWFLLPSESKEFLLDEANAGTIRSTRPFQVKAYTKLHSPINSEETDTGSVPYQIMQSAWGTTISDTSKLPAYRLRLPHYQSGNDLNNSGNESDNELFIAGSTVTGPSILFSGGFSPRTGRESPFTKSHSPNDLGHVQAFTSTPAHSKCNENEIQAILMQNYSSPVDSYNYNVLPNTPDSAALTTVKNPEQFHTNLNGLGSYKTNVTGQLSESSSPTFSYPSVNSPVSTGLCYSCDDRSYQSARPVPQTQSQLVNRMSPSPTSQAHGKGDQNSDVTAVAVGSPSSVNRMMLDDFKTLKNSFSLDSSDSVSNDDRMNIAMARVTNEIALELKSELREVIHQVEQGIDPDGIRERANSFNTKHDRRFDNLNRRTRTLSGHVVYNRLNRHHSEELKLPSVLPTLKPIQQAEAVASFESSQDYTTVDDSPHPPLQQQLPLKPKVNSKKNEKDTGPKWRTPPRIIYRPTLEAIREFSMIKNGDRILVCLSGGKDSLSLLHTLRQLQFSLKKEGLEFTLGAVTVDPESSSYNPRPLIPYLAALDVPYFYEEQGIMPLALDKGPSCVTSICSFCSRLKRGRIYATARREGYNVLAFGQHLDDLAESFLMSTFHNGLLRTMKAAYTVKEGDLRVIRPLVNVREKALRDFAETSGLPIIPENCPACFTAPTERHRIKQLLAQQEILFPMLYVSLRSAMQPLMAKDKTGLESTLARKKKRVPVVTPDKNSVNVETSEDDE